MYKAYLVSSSPEACWRESEAAYAGRAEASLRILDAAFQTVDGFGGCFNELGWIALSKLSADTRAEALDALFDPAVGCRFNLCRVPIGANDYAEDWYSHDETDGDYQMEHFSIERDRRHLLPYLREGLARRPDMQLFASPWSPPVWMKHPRAYNYGVLRWEKPVLAAYALYLLKFVRAYEKEGIRISQIHPQNEPASDQKFPSCVWTGEQLREFIADYLGPLFEKNGVGARIWLGTINALDNADYIRTGYDHFANTVLCDENARRYLEGVGYQWGGKHAIQRTHESWPALRLLQTENECGDGRNSWEYAKYVFTLMKHYFMNGVNGYVYWNMVLLSEGRSTWGWNQNSMLTVDPIAGRVVYNPEFYLMKHFSGFVDNGAVRLGTAGQWSGNALAFWNPNGSIAAVVCNPFDKEKRAVIEVRNEALAFHMPPNSFNTLVSMPRGKPIGRDVMSC